MTTTGVTSPPASRHHLVIAGSPYSALDAPATPCGARRAGAPMADARDCRRRVALGDRSARDRVLVPRRRRSWMLVLSQTNVVFFETVSKAVARRATHGDRPLRIGGLVVPGTIASQGDGVRFELTEGGETVRVVHEGDPPELFSRLRAGRVSRATGQRRRSSPIAADQARQRVQAADRHRWARSAPRTQGRSMRAALGYGAITAGAAAACSASSRPAAASTATGRRCCAPAAATSSSCWSPPSPRSRRWSGRSRRTTSRSSTSPRTSRARRRGSTRSPRPGRRSRARSCCGRSCSCGYLAVTTWRFRRRADGPARRVGDARRARSSRCSSSC